VVCGPRMREITGGENFFLGMQNTPQYTRDSDWFLEERSVGRKTTE